MHEVHTLTAIVVLPFRGDLRPGETQCVFGADDSPTRFTLVYQPEFALGPGVIVPTSLCTILRVDMPKPFDGDEAALIEWGSNPENSQRMLERDVLPRINHFTSALQHSDSSVYNPTLSLRVVGELDLIFTNLIVGDRGLYSRASPTLMTTLSAEPFKHATDLPNEIPGTVAPEWLLLNRAAQLANHGFYSEAVLVGVSLLDLAVQGFLMIRFPNLSAEDGDKLLRSIERNRLSRYFGLIMRMVTGASPLADGGMASKLAWLNKLRNNLIHDAESCTLADAQKALTVISALLAFLNEQDAGLDIAELRFWTQRTSQQS